MATAASADGTMNAVSYQPMPAGSALLVRPLDNSDHNMLIALMKIGEPTQVIEKEIKLHRDACEYEAFVIHA